MKFVSLESLLAWGREHVLGPFVSAATAIGGAETSSPEFKKLLIDKWGLSDRISERKARWSWLSLLSWGNKRSDDHYEALARAIPALEVATSGLDVRAYDSLERLHTGHDSYGVRLVSGPINEYVRGTLDTSIAYLMSLYDDNESMGCIENGDVRVASLLHSRTVTMSDGTSVAAPPRLSKARSRNQENSPIWLATADNGKGAKRVGVTDFCLLMLAQAYPSDESPSEWWAQISARTEEISKARQDQGGPHLLERSGLRACASFVTSVQMSHPQR